MTARRFGSVCSGIEAASVAFGPLGWEAAWLAEVDVAASQVLAHHYGASAPRTPLPGSEKLIARLQWGDRVINYGDMTTLPGLVRSGDAEAPDILCGGTPCQAFSIAGRREGLADARGQLTLSFVDLADAIDDVRAERGDHPCTIVWENVPGVLSDKDNAFGCFLAALAGEDLPLVPSGKRWSDAGLVLGPKRAVAWRIGDAQHFGLAQRRRRVFLVASAREGFDPGSVLFEFDGLRRDTAPRREAGKGSTHPPAPCLTGSGRGVERTGDPRGQDPVVAVERPDLDAPTWWDGSPVSQTLDAVLHKGQTMPEKNRFPAVLQPVQSVALRGRDGGATAELGGEQAYALRAAAGGGSDPYVLAPAVAYNIEHGPAAHGSLAASEVVPSLTRSEAKGHTVVCITGEITHTLKAEGFDGSEDGSGRGQPIAAAAMAVRRLMPEECEALQGFPRKYTKVPVGKKPAADGPRYKQLGNSWAVPHARWVGSRVAAELDRLDRALTDAQSLI